MDDSTIKIKEVDCLECGGMCCKSIRRGGKIPYGMTPWNRSERQIEFLSKIFPPEKVKKELDLWDESNMSRRRMIAPCFNLLPNGQCLIHKEYGFDAKPRFCKGFVPGCEECLQIRGEM